MNGDAYPLFTSRKRWRRRLASDLSYYYRTDRLEKNRGPFGTYWWVNVQEKANEPPISLSLSATGGLLSDRKYWAVKRRRERDTELYWASKK